MKTSQSEDRGQSLRHKHVPQRTCVACRQTRNKRELVRLVCSSDVVEIDPGGKKTGRGVYLCSFRNCWETGLKGNRIEFGLRTKMSAANRQLLLEYSRGLPK
jgi:hypothetical protein